MTFVFRHPSFYKKLKENNRADAKLNNSLTTINNNNKNNKSNIKTVADVKTVNTVKSDKSEKTVKSVKLDKKIFHRSTENPLKQFLRG